MSHSDLPSREGGFTIIEVVVVIAIIALVIALTAVAIGKVRQNARTTLGVTNLHQMSVTVGAYAADHHAEFPIGYHAQTPGTAPDTDWAILLNSYMTGAGDTNAAVEMNINGIDVPQILPLFRCPNASIPDQGYLHYSCHPVLMPDTAHIRDFPDAWSRYKLARVRRPSEVVLIMDGVQHPANTVPYSTFATARRIDNILLDPSAQGAFPAHVFYDPAAADNNNVLDAGSNDDTGGNAGNIRWRQHNNTAANLLFPDGSARTVAMNQSLKRNARADR